MVTLPPPPQPRPEPPSESLREPLPDAQLARLLLPPRPGPGVCRVCRGPATRGAVRCPTCREHHRLLGQVADAVLPVALAEKGGAWTAALWRYKSALAPAGAYRLLGAVLAQFLAHHEVCLAAAAGVSRFDAVTVVPSSRRPGHPLFPIVADVVGERAKPWALAKGHRGPVLLVEDTWTTGWHAQLAASALKRAGATRVALLVLGRHVRYRLCGLPAGSWDDCGAPCRSLVATAGSPRPD